MMCCSESEATQYRRLHFNFCRKKRCPKRPKVQLHGLTRKRCEGKVGKDMELENLRLYLENRNIHEENKKLRKKAILLHRENKALLREFVKKFSQLGHPPPPQGCIRTESLYWN
ncbi:hypothetical protein Nepgr_011333 [Nepenthes gracilis]|uniref:Uncharacterized protein n=1 Tax=Nepenthes gracilis TaxID=150966 RepID=A0AAD3XLW3_NEPGR|nr:hypothetical protein Nepgr_011333 [Nepenthes gracilis]